MVKTDRKYGAGNVGHPREHAAKALVNDLEDTGRGGRGTRGGCSASRSGSCCGTSKEGVTLSSNLFLEQESIRAMINNVISYNTQTLYNKD